MKSIKLAIAFLTLAALVGCASASLVRSVYEPQKGGVVKYKNAMIGGNASREKALHIMADFCAPYAYNVTQQDSTSETVSYTATTNGSMIGNQYSGSTHVTPNQRHYIYTSFRCDQSRMPASTPED